MRDAAWLGAPSVQNRSLIPSGMPHRSGASPAASRASAARGLRARALGRDGAEGVQRRAPPRSRRGRPRSARRAVNVARAQAVARRGEGQRATARPSTRRPSARRRSPARVAARWRGSRSRWSPSVTASARSGSAIGVTEVIGSTPVDVDLAQLLHEAEDAAELGRDAVEVAPRRPRCARDAPRGARCPCRSTWRGGSFGTVGAVYRRAPALRKARGPAAVVVPQQDHDHPAQHDAVQQCHRKCVPSGNGRADRLRRSCETPARPRGSPRRSRGRARSRARGRAARPRRRRSGSAPARSRPSRSSARTQRLDHRAGRRRRRARTARPPRAPAHQGSAKNRTVAR